MTTDNQNKKAYRELYRNADGRDVWRVVRPCGRITENVDSDRDARWLVNCDIGGVDYADAQD